MSSWQTKASCHVSIFFCLFHPLLAQRGCVQLGHCWGTVWHQLPAQTHSALSRFLLGGLCFLPCRNIMVPGAVQWYPAFATQIILLLLKLKSGQMLSLLIKKFSCIAPCPRGHCSRTSISNSKQKTHKALHVGKGRESHVLL